MFKLASLFVEIKGQDDALQAQVKGLQGQLSAMGVAIGTAVGGLAAGAIASAASALTGFLSRGIAGATNLGESQSKVNAVFGDSAAVISQTADELARAYGLARQPILDAGASIGLVAKAAGQSQQASAQLGSQMAKLAADASSFYNVPLEDALNKIRSGLVGEAEPLRAFGVLLSEEAVAAEAVSLGLAKSTKEVDNQAKVMARASLITKGLADASGDLDRTQDSTANQFRKFTGAIENMAVSLGESLAPVTNEVIGLFNDLAGAITSSADRGQGAFTGFINAVTDQLKTLRMELRNASDLLRIGMLEIVDPLSMFSGKEKEDLGAQILTRELALAQEIQKRELEAAVAAGRKLDAQKEAAKVAEQQAAAAKTAREQEERDKRIADELGRKQREALERERARRREVKHKEQDTFTSTLIGVSDFASRLRSAIFSDAGDTGKKQLEAQNKIVGHTAIIAEELVKPQRNLAVMA